VAVVEDTVLLEEMEEAVKGIPQLQALVEAQEAQEEP
jgi:hypothetical protein